MSKNDLQPYEINRKLKQRFRDLELDLDAVMQYTPMQLDLENRRLASLLNYVLKYQESHDRKVMELLGMPFPPIFPGIDPESDWYRFKLWLDGKEIRSTLKNQIPSTFEFRPPEEIPDGAFEIELEKLMKAIESTGAAVCLNNDVPPKLIYQFLWEYLGKSFELSNSFQSLGGWTIDGCSGYCPGCFQRPWCDTGGEGAWLEDERAGKMDLIEMVQEFVSPSPQSLKILQENEPEYGQKQEVSYNELDGEGKPILGKDDGRDDIFREGDELPSWN